MVHDKVREDEIELAPSARWVVTIESRKGGILRVFEETTNWDNVVRIVPRPIRGNLLTCGSVYLRL